jgi:hypothetical protein
VAALRATDPAGHIAPIFAQQSVRENDRLHRNPDAVMVAAIWSVFAEDWRRPWGADADHVKEPAHVAPFVASGYTFFTVDPSDHVDNAAQRDDLTTLRTKCDALPWEVLATNYAALRADYCDHAIDLDGTTLHFDEATLLRALAKYGRAVIHTLAITATLRAALGDKAFDLEMSVDETDTPTSVYEHYFIANELLRRDAPVVSLAPRFVGKFQKGVDYMGDLAEFEAELVRHVAVMRAFDRYKPEHPHRLGQVYDLPDHRAPRRHARTHQDRRHQLPGGAAHCRAARPGLLPPDAGDRTHTLRT